jgi:3-phosphoglycerate kinase
MFNKRKPAAPAADFSFDKAINDAVAAAHRAGMSRYDIAQALESAADFERRVIANSAPMLPSAYAAPKPTIIQNLCDVIRHNAVAIIGPAE